MSRKRRRGRQAKRENKNTGNKVSKISLVQILRYFLIVSLPIILLIGGWIYYPRNTRNLIPGVGVEAQCPSQLKAKLSAQIVNEDIYTIALILSGLDLKLCERIFVTTPYPLVSLAKINPTADLSRPDFHNSRSPAPVKNIREGAFGSPVIEIDTRKIEFDSLVLEIKVEGVVQESFDQFRLVVPTFIPNHNRPRDINTVTLELLSIVVPRNLEVLEVLPEPTDRKIQLGSDMIFFGGKELTEVNIKFLSVSKQRWKYFYNIVLLTITLAVVANLATAFIQNNRTH